MENKPNTSDLFSSAKVVAGAAQSAYNRDVDKIDKANVAGAAGDILGAASDYGNLKEKGYGQYVEKAEDYLHQYKSTSGSTTTTTTTESSPAPEAPKPEGERQAESGDALKKAAGLFKF